VPRDPRYDVLFEPVRIGPKVMRNRFYQTPHDSALASHAPGAEAYYRAIKAEGGWAVVNTGHVQIAPDYDYTAFLDMGRLWDDFDARNWALVAERIHDAGSLAGIELAASGSAASGFETRLPARSISGVTDDVFWMGAAYEMDKDDIRRLQDDYVAAARRARAAGFDIVNIHGAENWSVLTRMLTRRYNRRTDEYGGSLENRARCWLETLERVREAVGDDCAIAARHCIEDFADDGLRIDEEGLGFIELADHLVDFWDVQVGDGPVDHLPSRFCGENAQAEWIKRVRARTAKPIVGVGRFTSPDTMVAVITSGQQDIIGAARATISDPFLPAKIDEGRLEEIRECIGCNVCISRTGVPARIICTQNPTVGEEYRRGWHPERFVRARSADRSVLVVGAGPAGLECATVLAQQGVEHVHLVEASREVGGHFHWVARLPGLQEWIRLIDYRKAIAEKHRRRLAVVTNKRLSVEDVLDYGADRVIVATGSHWAGDGLNPITQASIPGADASRRHVLTPEQIMVENKPVPGDRVVVYDCEGFFMGVGLAERLALDGKTVALVTPLTTAAPYLEWSEEQHLVLRRLYELGVEITARHVVDAVEPGRAHGFLRDHPAKELDWEADGVVLVTQRLPNTALYSELTRDSKRLEHAGIEAVYRVGDCVAPRPQVADAIFDAHRLAREIDSEDPAIPLPWISEKGRYVGTTDAEFDRIVGDTASIRPSSVLKRPFGAPDSAG
jgi:dimethylamine/trimethylamine dehydrogenase